MLYEVKYGISLQMTKVVVNPLGASNFDFALGQLWIGYYNGEAFHAQLTDGHSGSRTFIVTGMVRVQQHYVLAQRAAGARHIHGDANGRRAAERGRGRRRRALL